MAKKKNKTRNRTGRVFEVETSAAMSESDLRKKFASVIAQITPGDVIWLWMSHRHRPSTYDFGPGRIGTTFFNGGIGITDSGLYDLKQHLSEYGFVVCDQWKLVGTLDRFESYKFKIARSKPRRARQNRMELAKYLTTGIYLIEAKHKYRCKITGGTVRKPKWEFIEDELQCVAIRFNSRNSRDFHNSGEYTVFRIVAKFDKILNTIKVKSHKAIARRREEFAELFSAIPISRLVRLTERALTTKEINEVNAQFAKHKNAILGSTTKGGWRANGYVIYRANLKATSANFLDPELDVEKYMSAKVYNIGNMPYRYAFGGECVKIVYKDGAFICVPGNQIKVSNKDEVVKALKLDKL